MQAWQRAVPQSAPKAEATQLEQLINVRARACMSAYGVLESNVHGRGTAWTARYASHAATHAFFLFDLLGAGALACCYFERSGLALRDSWVFWLFLVPTRVAGFWIFLQRNLLDSANVSQLTLWFETES